ncbi:aminotransferase class I/II-fold pyridoxal phosphate-dependent enzyme [Nonomuraea sp. NPDC000554]|uniref:aminotransferase class I/II-fold pyridoxal phosphate-dependent enzyme n=1 Tax=Nonomuraea sp. NPDC000554 TaxID=3154259 RepID=UPI00332F0A78
MSGAYWRPGIVQDVAQPGITDLAPGYLDPALLPVDLLAAAYGSALARYGPAALSYGDNQGVEPLREALAARAGCGPDNVLITAGTSHALHLLATTLAEPGDVVLCEPTAYDYGKQIFTDRRLLLAPFAADEEGPEPDALAAAIRRHRAVGRRIAFAYLIPTFHNPTGRLVGEQRRLELLDVARSHDVLVVEDDAYAELCLDELPMPRSLAALASYEGVVRLCSFAKTLGPGLRLGWMLASSSFVASLAASGLLSSGGGLNHLASLAVTTIIEDGRYDRRLATLRRELALRRDALVKGLGVCCAVRPPRGGFFLWVRGGSEEHMLAAAARAGVRVAAGSRFGRPPTPAVRLSYSFNPPDALFQAGHRLTRHQKG